MLTGVFPKSVNDTVTKGPLDLVWCPGADATSLKSYSGNLRKVGIDP